MALVGRACQRNGGGGFVHIGEAYAQPVVNAAEQAMRLECAALEREFPGCTVTWTSMRGYRVDREGEEPLFCESRTALLCFLAKATTGWTQL